MDVNLTLLGGRGYPARLEDCNHADRVDLLAYRQVMLATDATATRRTSGGGEPKPISLVRLRQSSLWAMTEHTVWETVNTYSRAKSGKGKGGGAGGGNAFVIARMRRYLADRKDKADG